MAKPQYSIKLQFADTPEPYIASDIEVIKKLPKLLRMISNKNPKWKKEGAIVNKVVNVPFNKEYALFLFEHVCHYKISDDPFRAMKVSDYQEANRLPRSKLREIIELATFFENEEFRDIMGYLIADKLKDTSVSAIAQFLGVKEAPEEEVRRYIEYYESTDEEAELNTPSTSVHKKKKRRRRLLRH